MGKYLISVTLVVLFVFVGLACGGQATPASSSNPPWQDDWDKTLAAAKKEGSVVVYHAPFGEAREVLQKVFKEKYGIHIEFLTGRTGDLVSRIITERKAGIYSADMMITGLGSFFKLISPLKITVPLEPLLILPEVTDGSKWRPGKLPLADKAGTVVAMSLSGLHYTAINTEMVKEGEIVSTEDVLNPRWKGKILINDPSIGGPGAEWFTYIMLGVYGEDKGKEYMKRLADQAPAMIRDERLQVEWVAKGKYPLGIGGSPMTMEDFRDAGAPIAPVVPSEGTYFGAGIGYMVMLNHAPHSNAAKIFINWFLSREGQTLFCSSIKDQSRRVDVVSVLRPDRLSQEGVKYFDDDCLYGIKKKNEMLTLSKEIFGIK